MIVIYLIGSRGVLGRPTIDDDCDGNLDLCEDGLDREDSKRIVYVCPECDKWLFESSELKWATPSGYWQSPGHTLDKPYYHPITEQLNCPDCDWSVRLSFFSYGG